ncbi:MAG: flagellar biosynthesis regulator FlaF [Brevundimonas sp.]
MSLQAYKTAATRAETPREMEYRLFGQVTRALMHAATLPQSDIAGRIDALDWNRRLWSTLASDCADPDNAMVPALKAQIISISLFVSRHSSAIMRGEDDFEALIDINRMVMQGLAGPGPGAQQAA